jgi:hypothetical protein
LIDTSEVDSENWEGLPGLHTQFRYVRGTSGSSEVEVWKNDEKVDSIFLPSTGSSWDRYFFAEHKNKAFVPLNGQDTAGDCMSLKFKFIDGGLDIDYFLVTKARSYEEADCSDTDVYNPIDVLTDSREKIEAEDFFTAEDREIENKGNYHNGDLRAAEYGVDLK